MILQIIYAAAFVIAISVTRYLTNKPWVDSAKTGKSLFHNGKLYYVTPSFGAKCGSCGTGYPAEERDEIHRRIEQETEKMLRQMRKEIK